VPAINKNPIFTFTQKSELEKLSAIIAALESWAPLSLQESYDNAGLITGHGDMPVTGVLICLDSTEAVVDEAIANNCNLIIAHHPIIFTGLKKLNGKNYIERTIIKAIKNDIAIYAIHTNLDNIADGVNSKIAEKLELSNLRILSPKNGILKQLVTYCPHKNAEAVKSALFAAGAGAISNYDECSFSTEGSGTFRGNGVSNPVVGEKNIRHTEPETKIEVVFEAWKMGSVMKGLREAHPYEEIAYSIHDIDNQYNYVGSGLIGDLKTSEKTGDFLKRLKTVMNAGVIRHTIVLKESVQKIAVCGGSGSFLLQDAIRLGADVFVSADFKYHQFFDADGKILIADIGHFESEQFTKDLIYEFLKGKFTTFALRLSGLNSNPINYF
jgi:dinuclear metal center YbgI/SA1388 family protein